MSETKKEGSRTVSEKPQLWAGEKGGIEERERSADAHGSVRKKSQGQGNRREEDHFKMAKRGSQPSALPSTGAKKRSTE